MTNFLLSGQGPKGVPIHPWTDHSSSDVMPQLLATGHTHLCSASLGLVLPHCVPLTLILSNFNSSDPIFSNAIPATNPPPQLSASAYFFLLAYNFLLSYIRNTPCFHCRKMALPDTNDPHFFHDDIAAVHEE